MQCKLTVFLKFEKLINIKYPNNEQLHSINSYTFVTIIKINQHEH